MSIICVLIILITYIVYKYLTLKDFLNKHYQNVYKFYWWNWLNKDNIPTMVNYINMYHNLFLNFLWVFNYEKYVDKTYLNEYKEMYIFTIDKWECIDIKRCEYNYQILFDSYLKGNINDETFHTKFKSINNPNFIG